MAAFLLSAPQHNSEANEELRSTVVVRSTNRFAKLPDEVISAGGADLHPSAYEPINTTGKSRAHNGFGKGSGDDLQTSRTGSPPVVAGYLAIRGWTLPTVP